MKCTNPDCSSEKLFARGLCQACYYRQRRSGSLERKNVVNTGICSISGCGRQSLAKNLCSIHYQREQHPLRSLWRNLRSRAPGAYPLAWDRFDAFLDDVGERPSEGHQLRRLDVTKPWSASNFVWREPIDIDTTTAEGKARYAWLWHLRNRYDLTEEEVVMIVESQGGACPVCTDPLDALDPETGKPVKICVDHDHAMVKGRASVRGVVHDKCNKGMGLLADETENCRRAAAYLDAHEERRVARTALIDTITGSEKCHT